MKTAVSIPDGLFKRAERFARRAKLSRSQLFSNALGEYVSRHSPEEITDALNKVAAEAGGEADGFVATAARRILEKTEW